MIYIKLLEIGQVGSNVNTDLYPIYLVLTFDPAFDPFPNVLCTSYSEVNYYTLQAD